MSVGRIATGVVAALVLVLALPTAVSALWSATGTVSTSVAAGRVQFAQDGFEALAATFRSAEDSRVAVHPVTVSNTGTVPANFSLDLGAETANNLARAIRVSVWSVPADADCTAGTPVPAGTTAVDWPMVSAVAGFLAPAESAVFCVRATISEGDASALAGTSMVATLQLTASVGAWTSATTARAVQSVAADAAASDGPVAASTPAPSAPSAPSAPVVAAGTYFIGAVGTTGCVNAEETTVSSSGTPLALSACDGSAGQAWQLSAEEDGYRRIAMASTASRVWTADGTAVRIADEAGDAAIEAQRWATRTDANGSISLVSRSTGTCLTAAAVDSGSPSALVLAACDGSVAQAFGLVMRS